MWVFTLSGINEECTLLHFNEIKFCSHFSYQKVFSIWKPLDFGIKAMGFVDLISTQALKHFAFEENLLTWDNDYNIKEYY